VKHKKKERKFPHSNDAKLEVQVLSVVYIHRAESQSWRQEGAERGTGIFGNNVSIITLRRPSVTYLSEISNTVQYIGSVNIAKYKMKIKK